MTATVLTDATLFTGSTKLKSYMNKVGLTYKADILDQTTFGNTSHVKAGGLRSAMLSASGYYDVDIDDILQGDVASSGNVTVTSTSGSEGDTAYFMRNVVGQYDTFGQVGQLMPFSYSADSDLDLVRGILIANKTGKTTDGTGSGFVVAAVGAGQSLSAVLHCFAFTGSGTLSVTVESDSSDTFSSPTTVGTFADLTDVGSDWLEVGTANTDTYYRITWTFDGTSTDFAVAVGVH